MMFRSSAAAILVALSMLSVPAQAKDRSAAAAPQAPETWITTEDYPAAALRANIEGVSGLRWDITAVGMVENCAVASTSGSADLDEAACRLITERGRYVPALDKKGKPVRSTGQRRVRWQIPQALPQTSVPYTLRPF